MPAVILTQEQRNELNNFPPTISLSDLNYYFRLSPKDLEITRDQKGAANRLGFAVQLGALRYLGFIPANLQQTALPPGVVEYLARQLKIDPQRYQEYGKRENTRFGHARKARELLKFKEVDEASRAQLADWLVERALEHDAPLVLLRELIAHLYSRKLVRPGLTTLEAMVVQARQLAKQRTFDLLEPTFTTERKEFLDSLLKRMPPSRGEAEAAESSASLSPTEFEPTQFTAPVEPQKEEKPRWSWLEWLRHEPHSDTPRQILKTLEKLEWLRGCGIKEWDSAMQKLSPNRRRYLAGLARRMSTKALLAQPPTERYPLLACFVHWCLVELTDRVLDLFDSYLSHSYTKARHELEDFRRKTASASNEKVHFFHLMGQVVLDEAVDDGAVRAQIFQSLPPTTLRTAVADSERLMRPLDDHYLDFFANYFPALRQFTPRFLAALDWQSNVKSRPLLEAIKLLKELNAQVASETTATLAPTAPAQSEPTSPTLVSAQEMVTEEKKEKEKVIPLAPVPANAPQSFIDEKWRPYIFRSLPYQPVEEEEAVGQNQPQGEAVPRSNESGKGKRKLKNKAVSQMLDRKFYELCVLWELRQAVRAGNIWVEGSRRYGRLENSLIDKERWHKEKKALCELFGISLDGASKLAEKEQELRTWAVEVEKVLSLNQAQQRLKANNEKPQSSNSDTSVELEFELEEQSEKPKNEPAQGKKKDKDKGPHKGAAQRLLQTDFTSPQGNGKVWLEEGRLRVARLKKQDPVGSSVAQLEGMLEQLLPLIDLPELLCEVDHLTGFSKQLRHAGTGEGVREADLTHLYAAILAQATNVGLASMSRMSGYRPNKLSWLSNWYLYDEPISTATTALVNFHYRQPLAKLWGDGTLSSSDGQRFTVTVKTANAQALPRYFGYGRGLSYYTSTSDQLSQFAIKVIPPTLREATYALDGLMDNESDLLLYEHTTDTHGFTEIMFALFDLLGFSFAPRIRDLANQQLYRLGQFERKEFGLVRQVLKRTIKQSRLVEEWDELMRLIVSLKLGWVSASLVIDKLQAYPRQNSLTQLLQEYGRVCKTIFVLRYVLEEEYRHRLETQLNKGEHLHLLRDQFFIGFGRQLRRRGLSQQQGQADCTNLVVNAIVVWNTLYLQKGVEYLRGQGLTVKDEDLRHIWPSRWSHLNVYGHYHFPLQEIRTRQGLRELRLPVAPEGDGGIGSVGIGLESWQRTLDEELELLNRGRMAELLEEEA